MNNNFYTFILIIEFDVRKILNVSFLISYSRENIRGIIVEKLRDNYALKSNWDFIAKISLIKCLQRSYRFKFSATFRVHAFVNTWVQIMRRKPSIETVKKTDKISRKGEISLRKSLTCTFFMWCI